MRQHPLTTGCRKLFIVVDVALIVVIVLCQHLAASVWYAQGDATGSVWYCVIFLSNRATGQRPIVIYMYCLFHV
jgi:hypothetical protein